MYPGSPYFIKIDPDVAIWLIVLAIVVVEFHYLRDLLVFLLLKLYDFFIRHNAGKS